MVTTSTFLAFQSPFICSSKKLSCFNSCTSSYVSPRLRTNQRSPLSYPSIQAELDQNSVVAISVAVVSVAIGIGIPVFYETRIDNAAKRENTQPCFPCNGSGARFSTLLKCVSVSIQLILQLSHGLTNLSFLLAIESGQVAEKCRFCTGFGSVTVELGGDEKEVSRCINCDGLGSLTCTTCQVSGIQPRYLDRREFKDDD